MDSQEIHFMYKFPDDYNPVYSNGAYGGINTRGEIVINFYLERSPIPHKETRVLNPDGSLSKTCKTEPEEHTSNILRYISSGVIMDITSAKSLKKWLEQKIDEIENLNTAKSD